MDEHTMNNKGVTLWIRENWKMRVLILDRDGKLKVYWHGWGYWRWKSKHHREKYHDKS
ncbi:MAG TPA: hypothetical protein VEP90_03770 [Methylomirabilota bacterium]|nr:hypothetical protein [Methylomirabilota bacterium]